MILLNHLHGLWIGDVAGDDQDFPNQTGAKILQGRDRFCSGHFRAAEIQKDRVKVSLLDHFQCLTSAGNNVALTPQSSQQYAEDVADRGFVLDDENGAKLAIFVQGIPSCAACNRLSTPPSFCRYLGRSGAPPRAEPPFIPTALAAALTRCEAGQNQTGVLAQNLAGAFQQRAGAKPINALINLAVKSLKQRRS